MKTMRERTVFLLFATLTTLLIAARFIPQWAVSYATVSLYTGIVVLGMILMIRTGLVSFGQGLYYALGAYTAGTLDHLWKVSDLLAMVVAGALVASVAAFVLGFLLAKYRDIFFAMLSLAFSMILYGILVRSPLLGSTDGFACPSHPISASPPAAMRASSCSIA